MKNRESERQKMYVTQLVLTEMETGLGVVL